MANLENLEGLERRLKIDIPADLVNKTYQKHLSDLAAKAQLKGFRKGKVPPSLLEKQYASGIKQEVANELIQAELPKIIDEQKIRLAGQPRVEADELVKDQDYTFSAVFEVYPEIELKDLAGVEVEKKTAQIEASDIDETMRQIQQQQAEWNPVERASADGDQIKIDFEGFIDDVAFDGGKAEDFDVVIGSKRMVPGFEEGLIGKSVNDEFDLHVTFPDDYQPKDLAAKAVTFKVKVKAVSESTLPELDDELAKKMGVEEGIAALQDKVKDNLNRDLDSRLKNQFKSSMFDRFLEANEIEVPKTLVDAEIKHMQQMQNQQLAAAQGKAAADLNLDTPTEHFREEATKRVQLGLLLSEVVKKYDLTLDQTKVTERIEEQASAYPQKEQIIAYYRNNKEMLQQIESAVLEDQALEKISESATIKEVSLSYKEVTGEQ